MSTSGEPTTSSEGNDGELLSAALHRSAVDSTRQLKGEPAPAHADTQHPAVASVSPVAGTMTAEQAAQQGATFLLGVRQRGEPLEGAPARGLSSSSPFVSIADPTSTLLQLSPLPACTDSRRRDQ